MPDTRIKPFAGSFQHPVRGTLISALSVNPPEHPHLVGVNPGVKPPGRQLIASGGLQCDLLSVCTHQRVLLGVEGQVTYGGEAGDGKKGVRTTGEPGLEMKVRLPKGRRRVAGVRDRRLPTDVD